MMTSKARMLALTETNIAPENGWLEEMLEDYFPSGMAYFQGLS